MSLYDYQISKLLAEEDPPFAAFIMAALRKADTENATKLRAQWPDMTKAKHIAAAREAAEEAEHLQRGRSYDITPSVLTLLTMAVRELVAAAAADNEGEDNYWTLGPFAPVDEPPDKPYVTIHAREGVTAEDIKQWLERNFQTPCDEDEGPRAPFKWRTIGGGNPLVNARIEVKHG